MRFILNFLFGKSPDIFDENGQVRHDLGKDRWNAWKQRYSTNEYNWRNHTGVKAGANSGPSKNQN